MNNFLKLHKALHASCCATKSEAMAVLTNIWNLTEQQRELLGVTEYILQPLAGSTFAASLRDGCIRYDGKSYAVIYRSCTPYIAKHAEVLRCSFRASELGNFVLVQPATKIAEKIYGRNG